MSGRVVSIHIAGRAGAPVEAVEAAELLAGRGIRGDRHCGQPGQEPELQLTLIEAERVAALNAALGTEIPAGEIRRNVVVRDVDLNGLVGRTFTVGPTRLRGIEPCEPCAHMARLLRARWPLDAVPEKEIVARLAGCGGLRAEILAGGSVRPGDEIVLESTVA